MESLEVSEKEKAISVGEEACDKALEMASQGDYVAAVDHFKEAENAFQSVQDQRWLNFLNHEKFRFFQAFDKLEEALALSESIIGGYLESGDFRGLALFLIHKSDVQFETKQVEEALSSLRKAETIIRSERLDDLKGYLYSMLAVAEMQIENPGHAIKSFRRALESYTKSHSPAEHYWCLLQIGICYREIGDFDFAEKHLSEAFEGFIQLNDRENFAVAETQLKDIYRISNQPKKLAALDKIKI